jgi:hypothetical protein
LFIHNGINFPKLDCKGARSKPLVLPESDSTTISNFLLISHLYSLHNPHYPFPKGEHSLSFQHNRLGALLIYLESIIAFQILSPAS